MILSIDPGVHHLALCVMSANDKKDLATYNIHLWEVYDILELDDHLCKSIQKNGKICSKKCSYKYEDDNDNDNLETFTCKLHFPKDKDVKAKKHIYKKKRIDEYLLQDITKSILYKIQEIYDNNIEIFNQLTHIYIELQPQINKKMILTSHIIYGKLVELCKDTSIKFIRASQKLKAYTGPEIECKLKGAYAKRKWLSVEYCKWFLENEFSNEEKEKWLLFFECKTVKPDLGDTFLMTINAIHGIPPQNKIKKYKKYKKIKK